MLRATDAQLQIVRTCWGTQRLVVEFAHSFNRHKNLSNFYEFCKGLELARNFQFPTLRQPAPSFLATMEEYVREAPCMGSVSNKRLLIQKCRDAGNNFLLRQQLSSLSKRLKLSRTYHKQ